MKTWIVLFSLLPFSLFASPFYYQFEGYISYVGTSQQQQSSVYYDQIVHNAKEKGFEVGSKVSFLFGVDRPDLDGVDIDYDANILPYQRNGANRSFVKYQANLIEGDFLDGLPTNGDVSNVLSNTWYDYYFEPSNPYTPIREKINSYSTFSKDRWLSLSNINFSENLLDDLVIGETFEYVNQFRGGEWGNSYHVTSMGGLVTLTNIYASIPEPSILSEINSYLNSAADELLKTNNE